MNLNSVTVVGQWMFSHKETANITIMITTLSNGQEDLLEKVKIWFREVWEREQFVDTEKDMILITIQKTLSRKWKLQQVSNGKLLILSNNRVPISVFSSLSICARFVSTVVWDTPSFDLGVQIFILE